VFFFLSPGPGEDSPVISDSILALFAIAICGLLIVAALIRKASSVASWFFAAGMVALAAQTAFAHLSFQSTSPSAAVSLQRLSLVAKSLVPGFWLCFSLTYARGNYREFLVRWRLLLLAAFLLPVGIALGFYSNLFTLAHGDSGEMWIVSNQPARLLNAAVLVGIVLVLSNLEKTFRASVGTMRWRIKFLILGLGVIFGARVYTGGQALLFSVQDLPLLQINTMALIIGGSLMVVGYARSGFAEIDIYPSEALLRGSFTTLIAGCYLVVVGVLAQIVAAMGGVRHFQAQVFLVLIGLAGLAALLLSDRVRQARRRLISRHFSRPQHDFRKVWTLFTERISNISDESALCGAVAKLVCDTLDVLSVTIWLVKNDGHQLALGASTSQSRKGGGESQVLTREDGLEMGSLQKQSVPFDLEAADETWEILRKANQPEFRSGGHRIAVPLISGSHWMGLAIVGDRVSGRSYTVEEFDLLKCIGDQLAASLLNLRLAAENLRAKELEALQTVTNFFVHDLKNTASTLSLMLNNLPVHFADPAFRDDAMRGIRSVVERINRLISRAGSLRREIELNVAECDLNSLVNDSINSLNGHGKVDWVKKLEPIPSVLADKDQLQSVVTNLLLNAGEALGPEGGWVRVETSCRDGRALLVVADNGCGMSPSFIKENLYRPFQTTKKKGLGIGLFQSRLIVEAHRGEISVSSQQGVGTTFEVFLPLKEAAQK
jgi:putative PEP-CTERM system histidine kinase